MQRRLLLRRCVLVMLVALQAPAGASHVHGAERGRPERRATTEERRIEQNKEHETDRIERRSGTPRRRMPEVTNPEMRRKVESTLDRVAPGQSDPHYNDGKEFKNFPQSATGERLLPKMEANYSSEYVYRLPTVEQPGREWVIVGRGGEVYYSPDRYDSFQKFRSN